MTSHRQALFYAVAFSLVYVAGALAYSIATRDHVMALLVLGATGVAALSYAAQANPDTPAQVVIVLVVVSQGLALASWVWLLLRVAGGAGL